MEAVAPGDKVALYFKRYLLSFTADDRLLGCYAFHAEPFDFKMQRHALFDGGFNQVFDDLVLSIHGDVSSGELMHVDAVPLPAKAEFNPIMNKTLAVHPCS